MTTQEMITLAKLEKTKEEMTRLYLTRLTSRIWYKVCHNILLPVVLEPARTPKSHQITNTHVSWAP